MLLGDKRNDGDNSIVTKLITRRVRIARRLVAKISPHHALPNRSPVGIPRGGRHHCFSWILHRGQVPDADLIFYTVHFLRWGSVGTFHGKYLHDVIRRQSSFHTSQKVRNRFVSFPELWFISVIGFCFCDFLPVFQLVWNRHRYIWTCNHCQFIIQEYRFSGFCYREHVKAWIIFWSGLAGPLAGRLQGAKD